MIPYGRQHIGEADIAAVVAVLRSDWLTQGPTVEHFEAAMAERLQVKHAVAVSSATAGLHIAMQALGVREGDCVWTSPITFLASANAARYCGADVDFVDIDMRTANMSVRELATRLENATHGRVPMPRAIVPVHYAGQPCEMAAIRALCARYGIAVIEDAAHAIGATYLNEPVGNCRFSDATVFSFHPVKGMTTAEGGLVTTNDDAVAEKLRRLRSHGVVRTDGLTQREGPWFYAQHELGYNYRMSDVHAALGLSQLAQLNDFLARRQALVARYLDKLADIHGLHPLTQHPTSESAWHLFAVQVPPEHRRTIFEGLRARGIGVQVHYIPVHTQPYYEDLGFGWGDFPLAEDYYRRTISLPLYPDLTDDEQDIVIATLIEVMDAISVDAASGNEATADV